MSYPPVSLPHRPSVKSAQSADSGGRRKNPGRPRVAVFGGSFNPPHLGHRAICRALLARGFEEVWLVPCYRHAFGKSLASFAHREAMCRLIALGLRRVRVLDVERRIGGMSRTLKTLRALKREDPRLRMALVVGSDAMSESAQWMAFDEIRKMVSIIVIPRKGSSAASPFLSPISSTAVRDSLRAGCDISRWTGRRVAGYIQAHHLYASSSRR